MPSTFLLNSYPVSLDPDVVMFPVVQTPTFEESTRLLRSSLLAYACHRPRIEGGGQVQIAVLDGPTPLTAVHTVQQFSLRENKGLSAKLVLGALQRYFASQGARTFATNFHTYAHWPASTQPLGITILSGIRMKLEQRDDAAYGVIISHDVHVECTESLAALKFGAKSIGISVKLKRHADSKEIPAELASNRHGFLGTVTDSRGDDVTVELRTRKTVTLKASALVPEASPSTLRVLESLSRERGAKSIVKAIQEASFATKAGRRNLNVCNDRFDAVQRRLQHNARDTISVTYGAFTPVSIGLSTRATELSVP